MSLASVVPAGVVTGDALRFDLNHHRVYKEKTFNSCMKLEPFSSWPKTTASLSLPSSTTSFSSGILLFNMKHNELNTLQSCTSTSTINAALEAAKDAKSPVIIQFSNGGGAFIAGKSLDNKTQEASVLGSVAGAHYVRQVAKAYGIPVVSRFNPFFG